MGAIQGAINSMIGSASHAVTVVKGMQELKAAKIEKAQQAEAAAAKEAKAEQLAAQKESRAEELHKAKLDQLGAQTEYTKTRTEALRTSMSKQEEARKRAEESAANAVEAKRQTRLTRQKYFEAVQINGRPGTESPKELQDKIWKAQTPQQRRKQYEAARKE